MAEALQRHDAWSLLVLKASRTLQDAQQRLSQAQTREAQLQASELRVRTMLMEYRRRHNDVTAGGQLMADTLNDRQFMHQLLQLLDQSLRACTAARIQREALAREVTQARMELDKAEKLEVHARARERVWRDRAEQKAQDDLATLRFQWRGA
jgi:flagellar biosynthesis chaperone FliJ